MPRFDCTVALLWCKEDSNVWPYWGKLWEAKVNLWIGVWICSSNSSHGCSPLIHRTFELCELTPLNILTFRLTRGAVSVSAWSQNFFFGILSQLAWRSLPTPFVSQPHAEIVAFCTNWRYIERLRDTTWFLLLSVLILTINFNLVFVVVFGLKWRF